MSERKYPVGIQTFSEIIREKYIYVDKTALVWQLAHYAKFVFLSRPRRFGKSLLTSTLESYFKGEKDLFEGLKIMDLEKEWTEYPVIHLDLSTLKSIESKDNLRKQLCSKLKVYETIYGEDPDETTPGSKLFGIIRRMFMQTGRPLAVIIDEYDAALLDVLHQEELLEDYRRVMIEFYQVLKSADSMLKFCFLTGVTRLSQLSIFSALNNLTNISLLPDFAAICGITEYELDTIFEKEIQLLALNYECSYEQMRLKLKQYYDGYHFAGKSPEIYNPFSLLSAFLNKNLGNYWFETGTPTFLIRQLQKFHANITEMDEIETTDYAINRPTEAMTTIIPLLYQTGYLTIKSYDRETEIYTLSIPNKEVRVGYADGLLPAYTGLEGEAVQTGFAIKFWQSLRKQDINLALREMQSYLASIPYVEGFKKKLESAASVEGFYEYTLYLIFSMLNVYVRTQVKCAGGRTDLVIFMPETIYVMELKINGTARQALDQINEKGYATPYLTDGRRIVKAGIQFDIESRTISDWIIG